MGNGGKKGKGCQGTHIKDPWTKPKGGKMEGRRMEGRRWGVSEEGESGGAWWGGEMETTVFKQQ